LRQRKLNTLNLHPSDLHFKISSLISLLLTATIYKQKRYAFNGCTSLDSIKLSQSLETIGCAAFYGCTALKSITFPAAFKEAYSTIDKFAEARLSPFGNCTNLMYIQFESIETVNAHMFVNVPKLKGLLVFPANLKTVHPGISGNYSVCEFLGEDVPEFIDSYYGLSNISTIIVPAAAATAYKESTWGSCFTVVSNSGKEVSVNVTTPGNLAKDILTQTRTAPASVNKLTITGGTLNEDDFATLNSTMTACFEIDMSEADCEVIPENAFNGRVTLKSIVLPKNTKEIKAGAFKDCSILSSVVLPDCLTIIGDEAFCNCDLREFVLEGDLETIGDYAFTDNYKLERFNFGNALTSIGNFAFQNCYSLTSPNFPKGLSSIGNCAFQGCSNLTSIDLSHSQNLTLGYEAFSWTDKLTEIIFPEAITTIPHGLLRDCTSLSSIDLSQTNVTEISYSAFENCTGLKTIKMPKNGQLAKLDVYALKGCSNLTEIDLSHTELATLDTEALCNCTALATVKLPNSLYAIGYDVFTGDKALRTIVAPSATPPSAFPSSFTNVITDDCTLVIPSSAFYDYVLADIWSAFFNFDAKSDITIENPEDVKVSFSIVSNDENLSTEKNVAARSASEYTPTDAIELMKDAMIFLPNEKNVKLNFACTNGQSISKVLLNNNDVTDELVDNAITLENITGSTTIKVTTSETSNINNVLISSNNAYSDSRDVYNMQGIFVKAKATCEDINNLSPGIYIVGGKKVIVQ
jgi:hypothetical protein